LVGDSVLIAAARAAPNGTPANRPPTIYHKSRSFRIPFTVPPADKPRLADVQLWVSDDSGFTWKPVTHTSPDRPSFTFRATRDAEYWFAVRTVDTEGRLNPGEDEAVEPNMKVVVDTKPPSLILEPDGRRGARVAVRWEVRDENLDVGSLALEYQAEGASTWRQVPISRKSLIGSATWDAGTAEPLKVRGSIADKARNRVEQTIAISEGTPDHPQMAANDFSSEFNTPPPIAQISSGSNFSSDDPARSLSDSPPLPYSSPSARNASGAGGFDAEAFGGATGNAGSTAAQSRGSGAGGAPTLLVRSPQFGLQYAVDDAGPGGPAMVELWMTRDGGRTWYRRGEDPDRSSPFPVDLGGEGTFGVCLVARGASGLGDLPPAPGDLPQTWIEVDSTPPNVQLDPPVIGSGQHLGKVAIRWHASDPHLGPQPVTIAWRADQPGAQWYPIAERVDNTGQFIWSVPPNIPPRFHLRVDVVDTVGNTGSAETSPSSPVIVDRARPRSRILGLDPSVRSGRSDAPVAGGGGGVVIPR
jgi:hypothetical protein